MLSCQFRLPLLAAICGGWLSFVAFVAAAEEPMPAQPAGAATQTGAAALQNFTEFLKAEAARAETATKHDSEIIEHALKHQSDAIGNALVFFEYVVGTAGVILVAGAGLLGWLLKAASRATRTDIEREVRAQLKARVAEEIEARAKSTLDRIVTLERNIVDAEGSLGKQRNTITNLVHWTMGYWPHHHLKAINDMKIRGNSARFEFQDQNAFKRELGFLIDNGYLENINLDEFRPGDNMLDRLVVTDACARPLRNPHATARQADPRPPREAAPRRLWRQGRAGGTADRHRGRQQPAGAEDRAARGLRVRPDTSQVVHLPGSAHVRPPCLSRCRHARATPQSVASAATLPHAAGHARLTVPRPPYYGAG